MERKQIEEFVREIPAEQSKELFENLVYYVANFVNLEPDMEDGVVRFLSTLRFANEDASAAINYVIDILSSAVRAKE